MLSYYVSFVSKQGEVMVTVFLNLWVASFYSRDHSGIKEAKTRAEIISGIGGCIGLIVVGMFGCLSDRMKFSKSLSMIFTLRGVSFLMLMFSKDARDEIAFACLLFAYIFNISVNMIVGAFFFKSLP